MSPTRRLVIGAGAAVFALVIVLAGQAQKQMVAAMNEPTCKVWHWPDGRSECR